MRIDQLRAPLLVTWQLTRNCDLACLHCCTESGPGQRLPGAHDADEAMQRVRGIIDHQVLALHHVHPGIDQTVWDVAFLLFGAVLAAVGYSLIASARRDIRTTA